MSFLGGLTGAQRDPELLRQDAEAKQQRLEDDAAARKQAEDARPRRRWRPLVRRRAK